MTDKTLNPTRFQPIEFQNNRFSARVPHGTNPADIIDPTFWTHVANQMKPGDEVRIICEDMSWRAEVFVRSIGKNAAQVALISIHAFDKPQGKAASMEAPNYEAEFVVGENWRVIRLSDREVVSTGFDTEEQAKEWIVQNTTQQPEPAKRGRKAA